MNKIKTLVSTAFISALTSGSVFAENIGMGGDSASYFQQVWSFFFG